MYDKKEGDKIISLLSTDLLSTENIVSLYYLGLSYIKLGDEKKGENIFKKLLCDPNYSKANTEEGATYIKQTKIDLKRAIEQESNCHEAFTNLGVIFYSQKNYKTSLEYFNSAMLLAPSSYSYYCRGNVYYAMRKPKLALEDYSEALRLNKGRCSVHQECLLNNLGKCI